MIIQCIAIGIIALLSIIPSMYYYFYYLTDKQKPENIQILLRNRWVTLYFAVFAAAAAAMLIYVSVKENASWIVCIRQQLVLSVAAVIAAIDFKVKKVPNFLAAVLILVWMVFFIIHIIAGEGFSTLGQRFLQALIGFLTGGIILLVCMLVSRGGIGAGDVKLIAVLGLFYGMIGILNILFYSCLFAVVISVFLLVAKKLKLKDSVPMTPFILMALCTYTIMSI